MKIAYLAVFLVACSGQFSGIDNSPLKASLYTFGKTDLNLHEDSALIICDGDMLTKKSGEWNQTKESLVLIIRRLTKYDDSTLLESSVITIDSTATWNIMRSEFGFHRLVPIGNGSYREDVFIEDGPPKSDCVF
jgi:hypothetical protein